MTNDLREALLEDIEALESDYPFDPRVVEIARKGRGALAASPAPSRPEGRTEWLEREVRRLAAIVGEAPQPYDPATFPPDILSDTTTEASDDTGSGEP